MKRHIFSRFLAVELNARKTLSELAQEMAVFYFNMRTAHFHTTGDTFLELHLYAEELYKQAEDYYDDLIETAISLKETVVPMHILPGDWIPEQNFDRNPYETINLLLISTQKIYDFLETINKDVYPSFVYSKIDSMLEYFDKQIYKIGQMAKGE